MILHPSNSNRDAEILMDPLDTFGPIGQKNDKMSISARTYIYAGW